MAHIPYIVGSPERAAGPEARPGAIPALWEVLVAAAPRSSFGWSGRTSAASLRGSTTFN